MAGSQIVLILGIETASAAMGCALGSHEGVLAAVHLSGGRRHVETLVPAIEFMCRQSGVKLSDVACIAADIGPGPFSGLRVGVATAKALGQALRVPTVGVPSLDLLAFPLRFTSRLIVATLDARRGEVFHAFYRQVPGGVQRLSPYQLDTPDDLAAELLARGEDCLLVGDGALRYPEVLCAAAHCETTGPLHAQPSAGALVELAHARALREEFEPAAELLPLYIRRSDAEINWDIAIAERTSPAASQPPRTRRAATDESAV